MTVMTTGADRNQTSSDLLSFINEEISLDPGWPAEADTPIIDEALVDSIGVIHIVRWLQDRLGIVIEATEVTVDNFGSVDAIMRLADRLGSNPAAGAASDP